MGTDNFHLCRNRFAPKRSNNSRAIPLMLVFWGENRDESWGFGRFTYRDRGSSRLEAVIYLKWLSQNEKWENPVVFPGVTAALTV